MIMEFDKHDTQILIELQNDARLSMAELGRRVHLSAPAVAERVRKLEEAGVIAGYRAVIDMGRLGYAIRAMARVACAEYARMVRLIEQTPEVINAYNVTGDDSWILEIAVMDVPHLDAVITRFCMLAPTSTCIVLNVPRANAVVAPARRENVKPVIQKVTGR